MGEVLVQLQLENAVDREMARRGLMNEDEVRTLTTRAIADSGAAMLALPQDQVETLGLRVLRKTIVKYVDERKEERPVAGIVTVIIGKREAEVPCIVGPPASETLLGQIPLEILDLLVDCGQQQLVPRPESPLLPLYKLY